MRFFSIPFLISPSVMTLKNKSVDGTDPSQAITLEFGLALASSETTFVSSKKLKARCAVDGVARVSSRAQRAGLTSGNP